MLRRVLAVALLVLLLVAGWVGVRWYLALGHLDDAEARVPAVQQQLEELDTAGAAATIEQIQQDTSAARDLTSDPVWRFVARFPWGGQNLRATATGAEVGDDLARDGLSSAVVAATAVADLQESLRSSDLDGAARGAETLSQALTGLQQVRDDARAELDTVDRRYLAPPVVDALDELEASLRLTAEIGAGLADGE